MTVASHSDVRRTRHSALMGVWRGTGCVPRASVAGASRGDQHALVGVSGRHVAAALCRGIEQAGAVPAGKQRRSTSGGHL